jgi:thiol:disulfide interchange protein DsbD
MQSFLLTEESIDLASCVKSNFTLDRNIYYSGENLFLNIDIEVANGYHIYSVHPDKSLSPTYINVLDTLYFSQIGIMHEPKTFKKFDESFNQYISYHKNQFQLVQDFKLSENMNPGKYNVNAELIYLACDETKCIPKWDNFIFSFEVFEGNKRSNYNYDLILDFTKEIEQTAVSTELNNEISKGLFSFIVFSIGMGFLALLTPCVFPMIPITVSYFTKVGEKENSSPLFSASLYALGIVLIFTSLGLLLSITIGASGAGDLAANPWVNIFIATLFIYLAFSLFGFYEIQVPSIFRQFSVNQESKGGVLGILFMSLTFTLTSFTCTVAFVGALLAAASQGEFIWPIIGMLSFSCAFASPFFFLALFPQYLSKLPQSGGWLNSVKVVMGFLELAAAFKFISNADLVWNWGIFNRFIVLLIWTIIFISISIYLLGLIRMPFDDKVKKLTFIRILFSLLFLSSGIYLGSGLFNRNIHGLIESYLPPPIEENWISDIEDAYIQAAIEDKPIFIDFTGYTCTNCRWMEINVFEDQRVKNLFDNFILTKLYTDGKDDIHKFNRRLEIERFGTSALPYYVILTKDDIVISTFPGMNTDISTFIKFLEESLLD